ncbi:MAG: pyridoxamine 5'-phosphate oxidase family protein [Phyllobacteriaceae bacterium]|nr:pyridoxamine 5'-phosphate oxidase family protein [Phyllobacteriaceae bacterium]
MSHRRFKPVAEVAELNALYGEPGEASLLKVADRLTPSYRRLIDAAPFFVIASAGPEGLDCSPRGERGEAVRVLDERTLAIPDRRGNNRIDTLSNIVRDPRVGLLFLLPGSVTTVRVNGRAMVTLDGELLESLRRDGKTPRSAIVVTVEQIYTQCGRAIVRSELWNPAHHVAPGEMPTAGDVLVEQSAGRFDGEIYDREWPERAAKMLW